MKSQKSIQQVTNLRHFIEHQSVPVKGDEMARCSPLLSNGQLVACIDENVRTLHDIFIHGLIASQGGPCLGWRPGNDLPYIWITYHRVLERCQRFGSGLLTKYAKPDPRHFIGLYSQNRVEWIIVEQMCNAYSMVLIPIGFVSIENIIYIINHCKLKIIIVDTNERAIQVLEECKKRTISINLLICMDKLDGTFSQLISESHTRVKCFSDIEELGNKHMLPFVIPKPEYLNTIVFSTLKSSKPLGVMLTHANLVSAHSGSVGICENVISLFMKKNDVFISYMPLSDLFERIMAASLFYCGGSIGFSQGDSTLLFNDISILQPTLMTIDPRIVYRLHHEVWAGAEQSVMKRFLLQKVVKNKTNLLRKGLPLPKNMLDNYLFKNVREILGSRLKICLTSLAPIGHEVLTFVRIAIGVPIVQGYGITESCACAAISLQREFTLANSGTPLLCNKIKIIDIPELKFEAKKGIGEICVKGYNVFKSYYNDVESTKESLDQDEWLHTGDVGMWLSNGCLRFIDSKYDFFKLSTGLIISPWSIESVLLQSPIVSQLCVYGNNQTSAIVAIVLPYLVDLPAWCEKRGVVGRQESLLNNKKVEKLFLIELTNVGMSNELPPERLPKKVRLVNQQFTVEYNFLSPSLRKRREDIYDMFKKELKEMCDGLHKESRV